LGYVDFENLADIISKVPKIESLELDNCVILDNREYECLEHLKSVIDKNKYFRHLGLKFLTQNKAMLFQHLDTMYNLNRQLSIDFINCLPQPPGSLHKVQLEKTIDEKSESGLELNIDSIMKLDDQSLVEYPIYDDSDRFFFYKCRSHNKNHKLFVFRDWEKLLKRFQFG
jgi:hypothetical protein